MHLPTCLDALMKQTYPDVEIMIIDNASVDGTVTWLEEQYPHLHLLRNTRNLGFSRAHNQAIRLNKAPYVLMLNPDVIIEPDWIERGVAWLEAQPEYGSFGGKLLRYTYSQDELTTVVPTTMIDTTGLLVARSRHVIDRGSGDMDTGQYDQPQDVFGHSGACVLFRRSALEDVRWKDEYLDEEFFAYKEDVDIAWRLQRLGWASRYDPAAVGHHHRHVRGQSKTGDVLLAKSHRGRQRFLSWYSYRNHLLMLFKLETRATFWRDMIWIVGREGKKFGYYLVTAPGILRAWGHVLRRAPVLRQQRKLLARQTKQSPLAIRQKYFLKP